MSTLPLRSMTRLAAGALCASLAPWSPVCADYHETLSAGPRGSVAITDIGGSVEVEGWDRNEVEVTGTPDDLAKRVHLSHSGDSTTIHVEPTGITDLSGDDIHLIVHIPARSSLTTTLVSAALKVKGLQGDADLRSINGEIGGQVDGNLRVNTVTGTVRMAARAAKRIEIKTVSGSVTLSGGSGEVDLGTVSGTVKADLGALSRGRFKSISGDVTVNLATTPDAEIQGESVSGTLKLEFASTPGASFDIQTFSGSIDNCFGPKPTRAEYGPGSKLSFKSGDGQGSVRIATKSGDVKLCTGGVHVAPAAFPLLWRWQDIPYVI